jgi:recombination protein RecA
MELDELLKKLRKDYGEDSVVLASTKPKEIEVIHTGALTLDMALRVGGIPRGRVTEIYGGETSGKTTLCKHLLANAQELNKGEVAFIDTEYAFDPTYAEICGVDLDNLYLCQVHSGEDALNIAGEMVESGDFLLVIVDSIAGLSPQAELGGEVGDAHVAITPRLMSQFFRKFVYTIGETNTAFVVTNQLREQIGAFAPMGTPETTPGGRAMRHYTSIRLQLRPGEWLGKTDNPTGRRIKARVRKSKVGPALASAEFDIHYDMGIDIVASIIEAAVIYDHIKQFGAYYQVGEDKFHGKEALISALRNDEKFCQELEERVRNSVL